MTRSRRRVGSWGACGVVAALLAGCSGGAASPIEITPDETAPDVVLTVETDVRAGEVSYDYAVRNSSAESIWLVGATSVIPDPSSDGGVVVVVASYPPRTDREWLYPPTVGVVEVPAGERYAASTRAPRPFVGFDDLDGDRTVSLPARPTTVRLCVAFVRDSSFSDESQRPSDDDGTGPGRDGLWIDQAFAAAQQEFACTGATDLAEA